MLNNDFYFKFRHSPQFLSANTTVVNTNNVMLKTWSKHVCNAVILPSHWSSIEKKRETETPFTLLQDTVPSTWFRLSQKLHNLALILSEGYRIIYRVRTHFSKSNSSTFQALLRVIFKIFQHFIAGVKYISTGIYTLIFIISVMYIVLCCKHLKLCFMIAKSLEIKGEHKVLSQKMEANWRSSGILAPRQRETWEHPVFFFFDIRFYVSKCTVGSNALQN